MHSPSTASKCVCGGEMRLLADSFRYCSACGRARWDHDGLTGGMVFVIAVVTIVLIAVLGWVGVMSEQFRME